MARALALDMGTAFDEMTERSFHACTDISRHAQSNRLLLLGIMAAAGWAHHPCEWWHYNLPEPTRYPVLSDRVEGMALMDLPPLVPLA
jgi:D-alanyl-D-alanine dipeptidase